MTGVGFHPLPPKYSQGQLDTVSISGLEKGGVHMVHMPVFQDHLSMQAWVAKMSLLFEKKNTFFNFFKKEWEETQKIPGLYKKEGTCTPSTPSKYKL